MAFSTHRPFGLARHCGAEFDISAAIIPIVLGGLLDGFRVPRYATIFSRAVFARLKLAGIETGRWFHRAELTQVSARRDHYSNCEDVRLTLLGK